MYYSDSHEWVQVEGDKGRVGISKHAQQELGEIVYVRLPTIGQKIRKGEEVAILESTKAETDVYSPVSGEITAVNETLKEDLSLINHFPESEGYLFEMTLTHPEEVEKLIPPSGYLQ